MLLLHMFYKILWNFYILNYIVTRHLDIKIHCTGTHRSFCCLCLDSVFSIPSSPEPMFSYSPLGTLSPPLQKSFWIVLWLWNSTLSRQPPGPPPRPLCGLAFTFCFLSFIPFSLSLGQGSNRKDTGAKCEDGVALNPSNVSSFLFRTDTFFFLCFLFIFSYNTS